MSNGSEEQDRSGMPIKCSTFLIHQSIGVERSSDSVSRPAAFSAFTNCRNFA